MSSLGGVEGDWGPDVPVWTDRTGTTANNGPQVQTNSVIAGSTDSQGQDRWSGMLQTLVTRGLDYAIQKDAAQNNLTPARAANGQPVYVQASQAPVIGPGGMTTNGLLLIGAAIVGAVLLVKSKG